MKLIIRLEGSDTNLYEYDFDESRKIDICIGELHTIVRGKDITTYKVLMIEKINRSDLLYPFLKYHDILVTVKKIYLYKYEVEGCNP